MMDTAAKPSIDIKSIFGSVNMICSHPKTNAPKNQKPKIAKQTQNIISIIFPTT